MWLKDKVIITDGTMVGIDLGTRWVATLDLPSSDDDLHEDLLEQARSGEQPAKQITKETKPKPESSAEPAAASSSCLHTKEYSCEAQIANWNCVTEGKIQGLRVNAVDYQASGSAYRSTFGLVLTS